MRSAYVVIAVTVYSALAPLPANAEIGTDRLVEAAIVASTNMIDAALELSYPGQSFCIGARLDPSKTGFGLEDLPDSALAQIRDRFKDRVTIVAASSCKVNRWFTVATDAAGNPAWLVQYTDVDVLFSETLRRQGLPLTARGDRTSLNTNRMSPQKWQWLWWLTSEDGRVKFDGSGAISSAFSEARRFYYDFGENEKGVRLASRIEDSLPPRYEKYE
jgi:hypothetical protein